MERRGFVVSVAAGLAAALPGSVAARRQRGVEAIPTLFHGHPDGLTTLVRFVAAGIDAPAGRLRVVDTRTGQLAGTAGMIRQGDLLTGELWLPLATRRRVRSELETPATRGVLRTVHDLVPTPRWVVRWLVLGAPDAVRARFAGVPPLLRGVEAGRLADAGVRLNPWQALPAGADHLELLRLAWPAAEVSGTTGVPVSDLAVADGPSGPFAERALRGAGVLAVLARADAADLAMLGLDGGRAAASPRVEAWLLARSPTRADPVAVVIGTDLARALDLAPRIEEWNAAYAHPRFAIADGDTVTALAAAEPAPANPAVVAAQGARGGAAPAPAGPDPFLSLARTVAPDEPTTRGIARRFAFPVSGLLVFNPSPFGRSGVIETPAGHSRLVTDVPGLGYAFVPDDEPEPVRALEDATSIATAQFRVEVDPRTGGMRSLVHVPTGTNLLDGGDRTDDLPGAVPTDVTAEEISGIGRRLRIRRVTPTSVVHTTIAVYESLPWVDVTHVAGDGADTGLEWRRRFAAPPARVRWEVPGGEMHGVPPVAVSPLRWLTLEHGDGAILLGLDRADAAVDEQGQVRLTTGRTCRLRIGYRAAPLLADDPWRFGFGMLPLTVHPAGGGDRTLPTFGHMVEVADPLVATLAVRPASDGVGTIVWLQDLGGPARDVIVRPDLLTFAGALLTDLVERDRGPADAAPGGGVLVPIEPSGYAAVRLLGVRLGEQGGA